MSEDVSRAGAPGSAEGNGSASLGAGEPLHPLPPTPSSPKEPSPRSNFTLRLLTATAVVPPLVYVIVHGGLLYLAVIIGIILLGLREFYQLIEANQPIDYIFASHRLADTLVPDSITAPLPMDPKASDHSPLIAAFDLRPGDED